MFSRPYIINHRVTRHYRIGLTTCHPYFSVVEWSSRSALDFTSIQCIIPPQKEIVLKMCHTKHT